MFDIPVISECLPNQTYWDCYWERFAFHYGLGNDAKPQTDKFWEWCGWVHSLMANYFLYGSDDQTIPSTRRGIRALCDDDFEKWANINLYLRWNETPELIKYNENVRKLYRSFGVNYLDIKQYVDFPSALLMGAFSNMKEYFAWGAFVLAWCYRITNQPYYLLKSEEYLSYIFDRPTEIGSSLYVTPTTENESVLEDFSQKIFDMATTYYAEDIKPYLLRSDLQDVRLFAQNDMQEDNLKFSVTLAAKTKKYKDDETFDLAGIALLGGAALLILSIVRR